MTIKAAQVVGLNTDQKAAQVISSSRGENYFFAVLILQCDDAFTKGRQALSDLADFYFETAEGTDGEKLTATFEESKKKFETAEFSLLLSSVSGKILYLISTDKLGVFLKRATKVSPLNFGTSAQLISGFLQSNDRLLFGTQSLITFLGDDLANCLELPMDAFEQDLLDRVGAAKLEDQGLAGLLVEVEDEAEKEVLDQPAAIPALESDGPYEKFEEEGLKRVNKNPLKPILSFLWDKRKHFPKSNRGKLFLAGILIVILALGVGFEVNVKKNAKTQVDFNKLIQQSKDDLNAAKGLSTLNPQEAKAKLDRAKDEVNKALVLKPKDMSAQNLKKEIEDQSPSILQQFSVSEFPLFLDLDLIKKNFRASQISMSSGKILLLDPNIKTLVLIDLSKKSNQILAGAEQLGEAQFASLNGEMAFVYSKDKGVLKIDTQSKKITTVAKKDEELGQIQDIYSFAGNVYLLDGGNPPAGGQIWKYLPTSEGYSDKREYLNKTTKADLAASLRMQIESSVYILKKGGEVLRFTRGDKDNFSYEGLPSAVKELKSLFVSSDTDNLYLLDLGNSRLLILTKIGAYKGQVSGERFSTASDLAVDEKGKKVYLLDGSKIFQVDLK